MTRLTKRQNGAVVLWLLMGSWLAFSGCEPQEGPQVLRQRGANEAAPPPEEEAAPALPPADPVPEVREVAAEVEPNEDVPVVNDADVADEPSPDRNDTERLAELSDSFRKVSRLASPSVVQVDVEVRPQVRRQQLIPDLSEEELEELRRRFGPLLDRHPELQPFFRGRRPPQQERPDYERYNVPLPIGNASGWIYDEEGHVITSHHVVFQAEEITVTLHDETEVEAELVGTDPPTDVAVLRIDARNLTPATIAEQPVEQGDIVLAIGSPFRYAFSVSQGIVSATERQVGILGPHGYEDFIQTDAAINPGNSGGPLINAQGGVVGMATAIASPGGAFAGLGFATPVGVANEVAEALIRDGIVKRGYLGAVISDDQELLATFGAESGVLIEDLVEDGPADQAGLEPGDVIAAIDDDVVEDTATLRTRIAEGEPGQTLPMTVLREEEWGEVEVTLGQQPVEPGEPEMPEPPEPEEGVEAEPLAKLGFQRLATLTPEIAREYDLDRSRGILVLGVRQFSAAALAGLQQGHILIQVEGQEVTDVDGLHEAVQAHDPEEGVRMRVQVPGGPARFVLLALET